MCMSIDAPGKLFNDGLLRVRSVLKPERGVFLVSGKTEREPGSVPSLGQPSENLPLGSSPRRVYPSTEQPYRADA